MLMNIECSIVQSLKVALTFDNNKTKEREIAVGDLAYFEFNKNGKRKTIEGKVIKIGLSDTVDSKSWFIIVDGSLDYSGQMERFCPNQILDCDIVQKHDSVQYISTPNDSTRVSMLRVYNGYLQVSTDGGYSWYTPKNSKKLVETDDGEVFEETDEEDCSSCINNKPAKKKKCIIVDDDEDSTTDDDDVIEDESY